MMAEIREEAGLDIGATLAKAVVVAAGATLDAPETLQTFMCPSSDLSALSAFLGMHPNASLAATGAGTSRLQHALKGAGPIAVTDEFEAWGEGERVLLVRADFVPTMPHLLVSLGTGTSILRVGQEGRVTRAGGTGLGGGTLRGFGQLLLGQIDHDALTALAGQGDRRRIDLLVRDLYQSGEISLQGNLTASNLGRVSSRDSRDIAHAITGLVGENVALLAAALTKQETTPGPLDVVYAGATLIRNVALKDILAFATSVGGARARFLPHGEFVGAIGAVVRARKLHKAPVA
jgi:type II pantothenate kinase